MVQAVGNVDGSSLTLYPGFPQAERKGGEWQTVTYLWHCALEHAINLVPPHDDPCPIGGLTDLLCDDVSITASQEGGPAVVDVQAIYRRPESGGSWPSTSTVTQESTLATLEVSVDDARLISGGLYSAGDITALKDNGVVVVPINSIDYTYATHTSAFIWSEANLVGNIGKVEDPTGLASPTAGAWLNAGTRIRKTGNGLTEVAKTWKFHKLGWK